MLIRKIQNAQTIAATGDAIALENINDVKSIVIAISGTSTSFNLKFEGSLDDISYFPIYGSRFGDESKRNTMAFALGNQAPLEAWEFDVEALLYFRTNLVSIDNGNITVTASATYYRN